MTTDILELTVRSVAGLLGLVCMLRFLLSPHKHSVFGPTYQMFSKLSDWLVGGLNRIIPTVKGYETAPFFMAWVIYSADRLAVMAIRGADFDRDPQLLVSAAIIFGLGQILTIIVYIYIAVIIIHILYSWINPRAPMAYIFNAFAGRILAPFRRFIPPIGNLDLTPIVAIFVAQVALIVINHLERTVASAL